MKGAQRGVDLEQENEERIRTSRQPETPKKHTSISKDREYRLGD